MQLSFISTLFWGASMQLEQSRFLSFHYWQTMSTIEVEEHVRRFWFSCHQSELWHLLFSILLSSVRLSQVTKFTFNTIQLPFWYWWLVCFILVTTWKMETNTTHQTNKAKDHSNNLFKLVNNRWIILNLQQVMLLHFWQEVTPFCFLCIWSFGVSATTNTTMKTQAQRHLH